MAAAAWGAEDFEAGLRDVLGYMDEALDQVRDGLRSAAEGLKGGGSASRGEQGHGEQGRGEQGRGEQGHGEQGGWLFGSKPGRPSDWLFGSRSGGPGSWLFGGATSRPGGQSSRAEESDRDSESGEGFGGPRDRGPRGEGFGGPRGRGPRGEGFGPPRGRGPRGEGPGGPLDWMFGGPRGRGFGGPKGRGHWGGGFGGPWGGWGPGPSGPPGPGRGPKASRGDVRAAILALLQEGPRNGYQIMSEIEERSGGAWRPSPGAVYPALQQLADEGLISGEEAAGRRTFTLTDAGREYIQEHPDRARGAWESAAQQEAWEVPGLFAEAARLGGGIVQIAHAGTHEQVLEAERLLQRTRRELYRILAEDNGEPDESDEQDEPDEHTEPGQQDS